MSRRVSRAVAALAFTVVLTLSGPSAFAANRGDRFDPSFASRIVRLLKQFAHKFGITSQDDINTAYPGPPKP